MWCKKVIGIIFIFVINILSAEVCKREVPISLKASLIIPCHAGHARFLSGLVEEYVYNQTVLVDEIIISLSDVPYIRSVYPEVLKELEKTKWPIPVILIKNQEQVSEGDNRNRACKIAKGDVFICQDADDIPHRQRVEIIKFLFENYDVDHLVHKYCSDLDSLNRVISDMKSIDWYAPQEYGINNGANGVASISRRVFEAIQWYPGFSHGVDVEFNRKAYNLFENRIVVNDRIYFYRQNYTGN